MPRGRPSKSKSPATDTLDTPPQPTHRYNTRSASKQRDNPPDDSAAPKRTSKARRALDMDEDADTDSATDSGQDDDQSHGRRNADDSSTAEFESGAETSTRA